MTKQASLLRPEPPNPEKSFGRNSLEQRLESSGRKLQRYISTREAAEYLGLSESFLNKARHFGTGPDFVRMSRAVRYDLTALEAWAKARSVAARAADDE